MRVRSGTVSSLAGQTLELKFLADFVQEYTDGKFLAGGDLSITSSGTSVRLLNRANGFGNLTVSTGGGGFQIASANDLRFNGLNTGGGWVVLDTTGAISGVGDSWLSAGSVGFRAGGSVVLKGWFAAASGTASSVSLINSAASTVLGGIRSDSSVTVSGSGSTVLTGDIVGSSAVTIATTVIVARDSTVVANGGRIEFAKAVAAAVAGSLAPGIRLDAGYGGMIHLGGSLGIPTMSLGWVDLTGGPQPFGRPWTPEPQHHHPANQRKAEKLARWFGTVGIF